MKKHSKNIIITLTVLLLSPLMQAQALKPPSIPPPLIAQREAGQYLPQLENLQKLLKEKKYLEFYEEASKTFGRANYGGHHVEFLKGNKPTREETAALEWVFYYRLIAPLLSHEQLETNGKMNYNEDFSSKIDACKELCRERTKEVAEMFSIDEDKLLKHRVETITATLAFLNKLFIYAGDTKMHEKEDLATWPPRNKTDTIYELPEGMVITNFSPSPEESMQSARRNRRSSMEAAINFMDESDNYVRKLVAYFPKQGKTIQEYIKKTGFYPTDFNVAVLLRRAVGRNSETEWVFKGLPSNAKVEAMEQKMIKDSHERAARGLEERKRLEKQKAEELARKQAEEARREAYERSRKESQVKPPNP